MRQVAFTVAGTPIQQGSKQPAVTKTGRPYVYEVKARELRAWRTKIREAGEQHAVTWTRQAPLEVRLIFVVKHPPVGRFSGQWCATTPDIDKLTRAVLDGLTGNVLMDDAQVVRLIAETYYGYELGVDITVRDVGRVYPRGTQRPLGDEDDD